MKKKVEMPDATNTVLNDKEVALIIQSLVKEAIKKGYKKTDFMNAISQTWNDMIPKKDNHIQPTDDEINFFEKVEMFFAEYSEPFIRRIAWRDAGSDWSKKNTIEEKVNNPKYVKYVFDSLILFTKCAYVTFCREDSITLRSIEKYSTRIFGCHCSVNMKDIYAISRALDDIMYAEKERPVYVQNFSERVYANRIESNHMYQEFIKEFSYRRGELPTLSLKLIWAISTYY